MYSIKHFINENGEFVKYEDFVTNMNIPINFITYNGWIFAIKQFIRKTGIIVDGTINHDGSMFAALKCILSVHKGTKIYYEYLTSDDNKPKCCSKWSQKINLHIPWEKVFHKIHKIRDVTLKWLQIRIVHRIIVTNVILHAMGIAENVKCTLCNEERDSIEHFLWDCEHTQRFWNAVECFFNEKCKNAHSLKISRELVIFGVDECSRLNDTFEFIIMFAKLYIFKCKTKNCLPNLSAFQKQLNARYKIEEFNAKINDNLTNFHVAWSAFEQTILQTDNL